MPSGWSYNPSSGGERLPIVIAALVAAGIAFYLAAYQLRIVDSAWDPFFGDGTERILDSPVSKLFPVSDALLGAIGFVVDAVAGAIGPRDRWRTMPWIVVVFGIFIGPLGAVSIVLVIIQPILYETFCTLCLVTAVISVLMIGPAMDEVLATLQHLRHEVRDGRSPWKALLGSER